MNAYQKKVILHKTMQEMPQIFTSGSFKAAAYKNGLPNVGNEGLGDFIKKYAIQEAFRSKTWIKKDSKPEQNQEQKIQEAITLLKSLGYKILKPVQNYEEI
jgi:hypothetical protein